MNTNWPIDGYRDVLPSVDMLNLYVFSYGTFQNVTDAEYQQAIQMWQGGADLEDIAKVLTQKRLAQQFHQEW